MSDDAFTTFWHIWRKHCRKTDGRGKARPAWQQMMDAGVDPQDIIDGANWYLRNLSERDAPYIPLAASWIRSERWADDCEQERAYQARLAERTERKPVSREAEPVAMSRDEREAIQRRLAEKFPGVMH